MNEWIEALCPSSLYPSILEKEQLKMPQERVTWGIDYPWKTPHGDPQGYVAGEASRQTEAVFSQGFILFLPLFTANT